MKENMKWVFGVPFEEVPEELVRQIKDRSFEYKEFIKWGSVLGKIPTIWTLGLLNSLDEIKLFVYGTWNPLENEIEIKRATIDKELEDREDILEGFVEEIIKLKQLREVKNVYFWIPSKYFEHYFKKKHLIGRLNFSMMEVI